MKKKTVSLLVAACMAMSALTGCGDSNTDGQQASVSTAQSNETQGSAGSTDASAETGAHGIYSAPGELPIVNEPITLTVLAPQDGENSRYDNLQTQELEELTGIHLEWIVVADSDIKTKLNLLLSSGEAPDIIMTGVGSSNRLDKAAVASLGNQGLIIPLNQYYDTVSVGYQAAFEELPGLRDYITTPNGNIYDMPNVDGSLHVQYNMKCWINTQWLENLNLSMPTTTEEFYEVLKAFKEQDANGNGDPNDEIPLSAVTSGAGTQIDGFLMNPFQLTPENDRLYVDNGVVTYSPVQDEYQEGLRFLQRLYKEGLLNPESFTQDKNHQVEVNESGDEPVIGCFLAQRPGYACDLSTEPYSKKWEQYQSLAPLKGPDGTAIAAWNPYIMYESGMLFISNQCKEPEAAFRLIDYLATTEGTYRSAFGVEGEDWRMAEPGELGLDGKQALVTMLPEARASSDNIRWDQLAGLVRTPEICAGVTTNPDPYADGVRPLDGRQVVMYKGSQEHELVQQDISSVMPDLFMEDQYIDEMAQLKTAITDCTREYIVAFITGSKDIDKDWDSYKAALESNGLSRYLEILQMAYDASAFAQN